MPIFVTQGRFTREYIKGGLAKPEDRHAAISRLCEQSGGKLLNLYLHWATTTSSSSPEMPDAKLRQCFPSSPQAGRHRRRGDDEAFTTAEAKDLFERAGKIAGSYKPMGAS